MQGVGTIYHRKMIVNTCDKQNNVHMLPVHCFHVGTRRIKK